MKKVIAMIVMMVVMMTAGNTANAAVFGEYEKNAVLNGTYEIVDKAPSRVNVKAISWSDPDLFRNQYRLYTYTDSEGNLDFVILKHHMSKEEIKSWKKSRK